MALELGDVLTKWHFMHADAALCFPGRRVSIGGREWALE